MNEKARLTGTIVHGKGLGHTVGMPTANLRCDEGSALPEAGVYASLLEVDGQTYFGVTNVGTRPTVSDSDRVSVETYLLGFEGDLYGQELRVEFCRRLRGEQRFDTLEALRQEKQRNIQQAEAYFEA